MSERYFERMQKIKLGLLPKEAVAKERKPIPKQSAKKKEELEAAKEENGDSGQDKWYNERRKECTGKCEFCGNPTLVSHPDLWRTAIAHLFAKRKNQFPSIATHESNWVELCLPCHRTFDDGMISWQMLMDSAEREMILDKCKKIIPFIKESEQRNIPEVILKYLNQ